MRTIGCEACFEEDYNLLNTALHLDNPLAHTRFPSQALAQHSLYCSAESYFPTVTSSESHSLLCKFTSIPFLLYSLLDFGLRWRSAAYFKFLDFLSETAPSTSFSGCRVQVEQSERERARKQID